MRNGADYRLPKNQNIFYNVYSIMLLQIVRDFAGLPDYRTLKAHEIRYFYNGLKPELLELGKK